MIDLFRHNFDTDAKRNVHGDAAANAEAIADLKVQLEEARQQGFLAGRDIGKQEARAEFEAAESERVSQDREAIRNQLSNLVGADNSQAQETERDIVELFSGIAERLVPELLDNYGLDLAIQRIQQSVEQARTDPVLTIRTSPEVAEVLQNEVPDWLTTASRTAQIDLIPDGEMNRGAAQVRWKGGRLDYDLHAGCYAVLQALAQAAGDFEKPTEKAE